MAARLPRPLTEDELRLQIDSRRGLRTDPRNVRRRARYRETHPRMCLDCGVDLAAYSRRCQRCAEYRELLIRGRIRICAGLDSEPCDEDVSGTGKQRCPYHEALRNDQVRVARNARRRPCR